MTQNLQPFQRVLGPSRIALVAIVALLTAPAALAATPENALRAFRELEGWVRDWRVPDDAPVDLGEDASGVAVTLRLGGRIVGRAQVMRAGDDALAECARRAWVEANQRLAVERDATRDARLREMAQALSISLEIGGPLTPLFGDRLDVAAMDVSPGREGVAARAGERTSAVFPGFALSAGMTPDRALAAALADLGMPMTPLAELRERNGVIVYRFESTHLAQLSPETPPVFLTRGGRLRSRADVAPAALRDLGDRIVTHLLLRDWPGDEPLGLMGVYQPAMGDFAEPVVGTARAQAMAALALACWADARGSDRARDGAIGVLRDLAAVHGTEEAPADDPVASALALMTLAELGAIDEPGFDVAALRERARASVTGAFEAAAGLAAPERAVLAAGMASDPTLADIAQTLTRRLFRDSTPASLPSLMPWLGWAELSLLKAGEAPPSAIALLDFRSLVWRHQLTADALDLRDADLAGGVVFTAGGAALPTDQTLRPLAFLATMLGDASLTPRAELAPEFGRLVASLRFLAQLTAGEAEAHMYADPRRGVGGVRVALWDQRMPLESSAMGLLTVAETLRSLEKRTGNDRTGTE